MPDGRTICPDDPDASAIISDFLGHGVRLENQPASDEKTGIDRATVFGDVPVSTMKADWTPESMPDYFQLMTGTFFEIGAVYLLASGSVDHLRKLQGGTAQIDRRRFRPNIYIESEAEWGGFVEDSWLGGALNIGGLRGVDCQGWNCQGWSGQGRGFPAYAVVCDFDARPARSPARLEYTSDHRAAPSRLPRGLRDRDQARDCSKSEMWRTS